jgi:hypothetical protein
MPEVPSMEKRITSQFRDDELVTRRMNGEERTFPVVGGRLRLAHEGNERLSITTELVSWDGKYAVCKSAVTTERGEFSAYGTANTQRDNRLVQSLVELAGTRSVARALRLAGYGVDMTSDEEVSGDNESGPTPQTEPIEFDPELPNLTIEPVQRATRFMRMRWGLKDEERDEWGPIINAEVAAWMLDELEDGEFDISNDKHVQELGKYVLYKVGASLWDKGFLKVDPAEQEASSASQKRKRGKKS